MEKKNTILLTTIAVATLLITVVGSTFAYFGVTLQNNSETVKISGKATDVGIVTVTTPKTEMHLNLTGTEMSYDNREETYYTSSDVNVPFYTDATIGDNLEFLSEVLNVSVVGGDTSLTYTCEIDLTLSKNDSDTMFDKLVADNTHHSFFFGTYEDLEQEDVPGLVELRNMSLVNGSYNISKTVNLKANESIAYYSMLGVYNNTKEQNFANTILNLELKVNSVDCKINK